jgi:hypothetical protein
MIQASSVYPTTRTACVVPLPAHFVKTPDLYKCQAPASTTTETGYFVTA